MTTEPPPLPLSDAEHEALWCEQYAGAIERKERMGTARDAKRLRAMARKIRAAEAVTQNTIAWSKSLRSTL